VTLPKELWGTFEHRTYLGALMKIGLKREKIGDILVRNDGADIVISNDIKDFIINNINQLTRFQKAKIESLTVNQIKYIPAKNEIIKINVASMRLDAIIGELVRCSRSDSSELLEQERVMVNFKEEIRGTRIIEDNTMITIRGKGRFKINKILGNTKSGRTNVEVIKW
jgi:RNA-binding protein YlmH